MRRILFPIIILIILFTSSCTIQRSNSNASNSPTESSQLVLAFGSNDYGDHSDSKETDEKIHDTICLSPTLQERQKKSLINEYLQKVETYKEKPDSVTYDNGKPLVEHYLNEAKEKMSFVFHLYSNPEGENAIASQDTIICTTINLSDFQKIGYLSYTCDEQQHTNHESLLDTKKNPIAAIDYQYLNGIPFPFITKYEGAGSPHDIADHVLNINQKFWIYKDNAEFDNTGKWTGYSADIYNNNNSGYAFTCSYDTNGNLVKIIGETDDKSNLLNEIDLVYQKTGFLDTVDYTRPDMVYGTADSSGKIHYDENVRMIYKENYITHGTQYAFYLYNDEDKRPWICLQLDSAIQGHVTDGVDYGNQVNAYLFQSII